MNVNEETRRLIRKAETCRILACGPTHVYKLTCTGELTPIRLGRRMTVFDLAEVHALADKYIAQAREKVAA
jgi:predicted DNA-binding transcriptional regulator AlpA